MSLLKLATSHDALVAAGGRHLAGTRRCAIVLTETGAGTEIPDVIGWHYGGHSILIECKVSLEDFRADRRKYFRLNPRMGMGTERWYLVPAGLLSPNDLPERWGLLEYRRGRVYRVVASCTFPVEDYAARVEKRILIRHLAHWQSLAGYKHRGASWEEKYDAINRMVGDAE